MPLLVRIDRHSEMAPFDLPMVDNTESATNVHSTVVIIREKVSSISSALSINRKMSDCKIY